MKSCVIFVKCKGIQGPSGSCLNELVQIVLVERCFGLLCFFIGYCILKSHLPILNFFTGLAGKPLNWVREQFSDY